MQVWYISSVLFLIKFPRELQFPIAFYQTNTKCILFLNENYNKTVRVYGNISMLPSNNFQLQYFNCPSKTSEFRVLCINTLSISTSITFWTPSDVVITVRFAHSIATSSMLNYHNYLFRFIKFSTLVLSTATVSWIMASRVQILSDWSCLLDDAFLLLF